MSKARSNVWNLRRYVTATDPEFGAKGDGVTNDTAALLQFFNYCIDNEIDGYIPAGTYLITKGGLVLDNGHVVKRFPMIDTAGYDAVEFKATANDNAPFLSITNGNASSGAGNFWRGGGLGGITFNDTSGAVAASAHGLLLRGIEGARFGYMKGTTLRASTICIEAKLFGGSNPDPYHVYGCHFDGAMAATCQGFAFDNQNYVGFVGNVVKEIRAVNCPNTNGGGVRGLGGDNIYQHITLGNCSGWAVDDRTTNTGGNSIHNKIENYEFDNVEFGFRLNNTKGADFGHGRFVHRYQTTPNTDADYWPREAMSFSPTGGSVIDIKAMVAHRLEAGGAEATLGEYINFNSAGGAIRDVNIALLIDDQAAFGIPTADLYTGFNSNSRVTVRRDGDHILDTNQKPKAIARVNSAQNVPTATGVCIFESEEFDNYSAYDPSTGEFTCPTEGIYDVYAQISCSGAAAGERIILTIQQGGVTIAANYDYATGTGLQSYEVQRSIICSLGDVLRVTSETNGGVARAMQTGSAFTFLIIKKADGR